MAGNYLFDGLLAGRETDARTLVKVPVAGVELDAGQLIKTLEPTLARFKLPRQVFVIDELPRNAMGKVQKNILRANYG